jgi:hypothetical protein
LEFHHINPAEKEFNFGSIMARPKAWNKIVTELRKCICVCSNCHREVHAGITHLNQGHGVFDEKFATFYEDKRSCFYNECPYCGKRKLKRYKYCSHACASYDQKKINWESIDIVKLRHLDRKSLTEIGELLGVSPDAVSKRFNKIGIKSGLEDPYFYDI